jgi:hypothetical protein
MKTLAIINVTAIVIGAAITAALLILTAPVTVPVMLAQSLRS